MAPVSQGGVQASLARLYLKELQYLIYHDRDMHTHRGASLLDDLCHGFRVLFRLELLIFFLVTFGMRSLVAHTALMLLAFLFHVFPSIFSFKLLPVPGILLCNRPEDTAGVPGRNDAGWNVLRNHGT